MLKAKGSRRKQQLTYLTNLWEWIVEHDENKFTKGKNLEQCKTKSYGET